MLYILCAFPVSWKKSIRNGEVSLATLITQHDGSHLFVFIKCNMSVCFTTTYYQCVHLNRFSDLEKTIKTDGSMLKMS